MSNYEDNNKGFASASPKRHSVLLFDSLEALQSKCMLLSVLLTVQSTVDGIKYSRENMPSSKERCLNFLSIY